MRVAITRCALSCRLEGWVQFFAFPVPGTAMFLLRGHSSDDLPRLKDQGVGERSKPWHSAESRTASPRWCD